MPSAKQAPVRDIDSGELPPAALPFPRPSQVTRATRATRREALNHPGIPESMDDVLAAFDTMSRRISDLASELDCLGYFDDPNGDLPRAA